MPKTLSHSQALGLMVLATLLWSTAGVVSRQLTHAQGFEVTFWRSFFTVLSLSVLLPMLKGRALFMHLPWRDKTFWLSGVCWSVMFTAFMLALTMTTVANVLITMAMGPMFTALLSRLVLKKPLAAHTWWAIAAAGVGMAFMFISQVQLEGTRHVWGMAVPCLLAVRAAQVLASHEVALLALLEVLFGIAWAWWGAGEEPGLNVLVGGGLVLCALAWNESRSRRTQHG